MVGRGGEGEVWEARDERGRVRALKLVRPDALAAEVDERIRALLLIDHPCLVRTFRGGRLSGGGLQGWGFVEMDFIDGPSLHDAPPDPAVLERLEPLAEALDLLHEGEWSDGMPLVHRDIKPANLVARSDGSIVLVDPSTLRSLDTTTITRIGTPVFAAPEILTGRIGPPADVYSFAATIVALLTGERGERLARLLDHVEQLDLPDGVRRALSLHPAERPSSCLAVFEAGMQADPTVLLPPLDQRSWIEPGQDQAWDDRLEQDAPRRRPWGWVLVLLALVAAPVASRELLVSDRRTALAAVAVAIGLHLLACLAGREPFSLTVFAPPVAWADLLARRVAPPTLRREWARAVLTGATLVISAGLLAYALPTLVRSPAPPVAVLGVGLLIMVLSVTAAGAPGVLGFLLRLLLLPAWVLGALVIVLGGLLIAPFAGTARVAGRTLASFVEVFRRAPGNDLG